MENKSLCDTCRYNKHRNGFGHVCLAFSKFDNAVILSNIKFCIEYKPIKKINYGNKNLCT